MNDVIRGFSRAMYSNWLWHRPLHLLIDAGEGLQIDLSSNVFSPSCVAITHGHSDHVLGLPGLIGSRRFGKGATEKPLTIVYPEGSRGVAAVREFLAIAYRDVVFPISWVAVTPGFRHQLGKNRTLEAFPVRHTADEPALGYRVVEIRKRLRAEFAHLTQDEVETAARQGRRDQLLEDARHIVFAHSGDAMPVEAAEVRDADLLIHDATFLDEQDRRELIHATTEEALTVARTSSAKQLVLHHLSIRYDRSTAISILRQQVQRSGFRGPCWLLDEAAFIDLQHF